MPETKAKPQTKTKSLTWTQVKRHIGEFSQAALLDLIHQLYNASDINKGFLTARFQPNAMLGSKELEAMKAKIHRYMCPKTTSFYDYYLIPKYAPARKIIRDYKKSQDTLGTLDLMLTFVEAGNEFTVTYGDIDSVFYDSLCSMLDSFAKLFLTTADEHIPYFEERLKALYTSSRDMGWGYGDYVHDTLKVLGVLDKKSKPLA